MIDHIVLLRPSDDASEAELEEMYSEVEALEERVESVEYIEYGENISSEDKSHGFEHGFIVGFENQEARSNYLEHPVHLEVAEKYIEPIVENVIVFDYEK